MTLDRSSKHIPDVDKMFVTRFCGYAGIGLQARISAQLFNIVLRCKSGLNALKIARESVEKEMGICKARQSVLAAEHGSCECHEGDRVEEIDTIQRKQCFFVYCLFHAMRM